MGVLDQYFKILVPSEGGSRIYLLKETVPESVIQAAVNMDLDAVAVRDIFSNSIKIADEKCKGSLLVAEINALQFLGYIEDAKRKLNEFKRKYSEEECIRWGNILSTI